MKGAGVTIVTQTCPGAEHRDAFSAWQQETSRVVAGFAGFVRQTVLPPSPPTQVDWLILQSFDDRESAVAWLQSDARLRRVEALGGLLAAPDDVHLMSGDVATIGRSPVSAVLSTRVRAGHEAAYRAWEQRVAAVQSQAPGFEGYRLEPPIPGVQEDWVAILRFESAELLQAWLDSPERSRLLSEAGPFTEAFHSRIVRTGFDQWFNAAGPSAASAPAWKQNMIVLLLLYPIVFLFGYMVGTPLLMSRWHMPFAVALFMSNVVSTVLLNYSVPWISQRFGWWLQPSKVQPQRATWLGTGLVIMIYILLVAAFTLLF